MKKLLVCFALGTFVACSGPENYKKAEDAEDAGREFIRASLDGDYRKAKFYLLQDSDNIMLLDKWQTNYDKLNTEERISYKNANILPISITNQDDSTVSYVFTNSYKQKDTTTIRIVRRNGEWLVDFKDLH
jgi:hypothetical protein